MSTPFNNPPPGGDFSQQPFQHQNQPAGQQFHHQPLPPGKKGGGIWLWVIGGCLGIVLLGGIAVATLGYFGMKKFQETTGLSSEEFENRPAFAAAKLLTALNPEIELVEAEEATQRITIREKRTGKTVSVTLDELKEGRIRFTDSEGEEFDMRVQGEGDSGSVNIQSSDGRQVLNIGSASSADFPEWAPVPEGTFTGQQRVSSGGTEVYGGKLTSSLAPEAFANWFEAEAKSHGLKVTNRTITRSNSEASVYLQAASEGGNRILTAIGSQNSSGGCDLLFSAVEKP